MFNSTFKFNLAFYSNLKFPDLFDGVTAGIDGVDWESSGANEQVAQNVEGNTQNDWVNCLLFSCHAGVPLDLILVGAHRQQSLQPEPNHEIERVVSLKRVDCEATEKSFNWQVYSEPNQLEITRRNWVVHFPLQFSTSELVHSTNSWRELWWRTCQSWAQEIEKSLSKSRLWIHPANCIESSIQEN